MDAQSIHELQKIDCNCNDCKFMVRDLEKKNYWNERNREWQLTEFNRRKERGHIRHDAQFQFDKKRLTLQYGKCSKFDKDIIFLPGHCQPETQECFVHRKD